METTWICKVTEVHWARVFLDQTEPVYMPLHQRSDTLRGLVVRPLPLPAGHAADQYISQARFPSSRNDDALALFERGGTCCPVSTLGHSTEKCVIEDSRSQADGSAVAYFVATENPALAENRAVLLAGNLLRYLKDHLNQRALR